MNEKEELLAKIDRLEENLNKLKSLAEMDREELLDDFRNIEASKHLLQTSIEIMIDISNMLIARRRLGQADTNAEAFIILAQNDIISQENQEKYTVMASFRNRVVHMYDSVNEKEIYDILNNNLEDFRLFIKEVLELTAEK